MLDVYRLGIILSKYLSPKKKKVNLCFVVNSYLGTPVYSMYDGVVVKVEDWIKSVINDEYSIVITYAHLQSGNAYDVPNKHVHIGIKVDGDDKWIDPATIDDERGKIKEIRCDD